MLVVSTDTLISVKDLTNLHLDPVLYKINLENKQCILMGYFNVDLLKSHQKLYFLKSYPLTVLLLTLCEDSDKKSLIDNIFFNHLGYQALIYYLKVLTIFLILGGFVKKKRTILEINLFKRDLSHFNEREIEEVVINWDQVCDLEKDPNFS